MLRNEELAIFPTALTRQELQRLRISGVLRVLAAGTARIVRPGFQGPGLPSLFIASPVARQEMVAAQTYIVLSESTFERFSESRPPIFDAN